MSLDVKFSATDINLTQTVSKIKEEMEEMDNEVKKTSNGVQTSFGDMVKGGAALALGFGAIKAAGAAIVNTFDTFKNALDLGGTMKDLSERTGETAGNLMILSRAFDNSGVGADKVGTSINKLQKFMDDAGQGGEKQIEVLGRLGLTMDDMAGKTPTEQMAMLAEKLNGVSDNGERSALAMSVFGKAGGVLLPLLADFSGEMKTAQDQLGSMPGVLDRSSGAFDNISDNINVAKGKFLEFAAGLLESIAPALELATDLMTRFDAAGAGMKLGEIITGASKAMGGFSDALSAIKLGKFQLAFDIAFASIKLQAADTINSIFANVTAAVQAAGTFIVTAFGPGSGIYTIVGAQFDILSSQFQIAMIGGVKAIATALTSMFDTPLLNAARKINPVLDYQLTAIAGIAKGFDGVIGSLNKGVENSQNKISNAVGQIGGDFKLAGQEARKAYDQALSSSNKLIDTEELKLQLKKEQNKLDVLEATARSEAAKAALKNFSVEELTLEIGKERVNNAQRIKELDADIASAKRQGNKEELGNLESMKAYYKELQASREKGLTLEQSITNANIARQNVIDEILKKNKKIVEETGNVKENMERIKTLGDLIAKTNAAAPMKTFTERSKEARAEVKKLKDFLGGDFSRMNIFDLAKKLGISTTRKSSEELLKMIEEKLKKINATPIDLMINKDASKKDLEEIQKEIGKLKTDKEVTLNATSSVAKIRSEMAEEIDLSLSSSKGTSELSTITSVVEAIRDLVKSLEKKLPMPALGA
jgi:hypothetical protein